MYQIYMAMAEIFKDLRATHLKLVPLLTVHKTVLRRRPMDEIDAS